uniref:Arp2 3 complex subunit n=1 Tax=Colletotrichum fructicola (strain Nara gc5) TaxID=1213859 RepID=L2GFT8_COLFN
MTPLLKSIYGSPGGPELLDVLMNQIGGRPGGTNENVGSAMSVLLSWHEKVVDVAGLGSIGRVMTDWRRV